MILTCPNCTTRFLLSAFVLAPDGRKVKCSNCDESWFQLPDPEELNAKPEEKPQDIPEGVKPIPKGSAVPAVREDKEEGSKTSVVKIAIAAAICLVILGALLVMLKKPIMTAMPTTLPLYKTIGAVSSLPGEGLVFDRLQAEESQNSEHPQIFLSGTIINLTSNDVTVPNMLAELRDKQGNVVKAILIEPPAGHLAAEETMPFEAVFEDDGKALEVFVRFVLGTPSGAVSNDMDYHSAPEPETSHDDEAATHHEEEAAHDESGDSAHPIEDAHEPPHETPKSHDDGHAEEPQHHDDGHH